MITIASSPQLITTLNLAMFKVISDRPTIIQFKVNILDGVTGFLITSQNYATVPMIERGTSFDVSKLLSAFVQPQIINSINVLEQTPKIIKSYKLQITEYYLDENGEQQEGDILTTDVFKILNAELSRIDFRGFDYTNYVIGASENPKFLSSRPSVSNVILGDKEYIYLLTSVDCIVRARYYRANGTLLSSRDTYVSGDNMAYRVEISPIYGVYENSNPFTPQFTPPFGIAGGADFAAYFTVVTLSMGMEEISETKTYRVIKGKCSTERRQLFFVNNLAGMDSFSFTNPRQSVSTTKTDIRVNKYQYDENGDYTDFSNGVYNQEISTIASSNQNTFSLISDVLTDDTAKYAARLLESNDVYIRLLDNTFFPIKLEPNEYGISKRKVTTANERLTVRFRITDINLSI